MSDKKVGWGTMRADILPFVRMNSDKEVMEFFITTLTQEETMAFYCRIRKEFEEYGYGCLLYTSRCV